MNRSDDDLHDPALSRLYRELPDEQPGAGTDAAIRAAARRAVGAGPGRQRLFTTSRITATAAALLLGVALTVQWQREDPERLREALATSGKLQSPRETADAAPRPARTPASAPPATAAAPAIAAPSRGETVAAGQELPAAPATSLSGSRSDNGDSEDLADARANVASPEAGANVASAEAPHDVLERKQEGATGEADSAPLAKAAERVAKARHEEERRSADALAPSARQRSLAAQPQAPAPAAAPAPAGSVAADYRLAMADGRLEQALDLLPAEAGPAQVLDRDLLQAASGRAGLPACAGLVPAPGGGEALLCALLRQRASGNALPTDWRERLQASGAIAGDRAYRRVVVESLWGEAMPAR